MVYCWGVNSGGTINGNTNPAYFNTPVPVAVYEGGVQQTVKKISSGEGRNCVLSTANNWYCWGFFYYASGNGNTGPTKPQQGEVAVGDNPVYMDNRRHGAWFRSIQGHEFLRCTFNDRRKELCYAES
jgi:hypothetical protein